jgi:hypothetical protein
MLGLKISSQDGYQGAEMSTVTEAIHENYVIKAGVLEGEYVARAFEADRKMRGAYMQAIGDTPEEAIESLKTMLTEAETKAKSRRRWDEAIRIFVPTELEYRTALRTLPLSDSETTMLKAHALAGNRGMTAREIGATVGYDLNAANAQYGKIGTRFGEYIKVDFPQMNKKNADLLRTAALATKGAAREDGAWVWVMHPELIEAMTQFS